MSLIYSPTIILTSISILLRTLIALSRTNWILLWGAIELNLLRFIPIILQTKTNQEVEGSVKYFLAQALGSALLLFSSTAIWIPFSLGSNYIPLLLSSAILLKLGRVPCHFWYPSVMSSISWTSCLILSTWQKLAPLIILAFLIPQKNSQFIIVAAGVNALVGGLIGINQSRLRVIIAYSSIGHIGWILRLLAVYKPNASIIYFIVYTALITPLFLSINYFNIYTTKHLNTSKSRNTSSHWILIILLLSLGGLPPLTGFMPKFITIIILTEYTSIVVITLILGSLINLFFYLRIVINMMLSSSNLKTLLPIKSLPRNAILITATLSLGFRPFILIYAMTLFNKSQRYWNSLFHSRGLSRYGWCWYKPSHSNRAKATRCLPRKGPTIQYNCYSPCICNNFLSGYACIYWWIWKLTSTSYTGSSRHSLSTSQQHKILTSAPFPNSPSILCCSGKGCWNRVDSLPTPIQ